MCRAGVVPTTGGYSCVEHLETWRKDRFQHRTAHHLGHPEETVSCVGGGVWVSSFALKRKAEK